VKAASYDNILLRRQTGARKPALPMREAWPFKNRQPDHRKTRFYTWQSSVVVRLLQRSAQKSDPTVVLGFPFSTVLAVVALLT
jgi:hypothetical protein